MNYHVTVRAINSAGKGHWAMAPPKEAGGIILPHGPLRTKSNVPAHCPRLNPKEIETTSCTFAFELPYNNGERIEQCIVKTTWLNGPVADHEKDPLTMMPHSHICEREDTFDPWQCKPTEAGSLPVYTLENLLPGTDYKVTWCAVNSLGRGMASPSVVINTKAAVPDIPNAPMPKPHDGEDDGV